ncbi:MAG: arginase [Flavobacteriales bacterium]|nr:arginase [Flavobacteriales bacterium]
MNHIEGYALIEVRSDVGAGTEGAALGAQAIRAVAEQKGDTRFLNLDRVSLEFPNGSPLEENQTPWAKHIVPLLKFQEKVADEVYSAVHQGKFPVLLTGDHSSAIGIISGFKKAFADKNIGVVWIDAHADLHSPYTTPSGNLHGMPLAALIGEDNLEHQIHQPSETTEVCWKQMKNLAFPAPKFTGKDLVFVGVRSTETPEDKLIARHGIRKITVDDVRKSNGASIAQEVLETLSHCDAIFVSFDVDSLDPSISAATGTPVDHGLNLEEVHDMMRVLLKDSRVKGLEVTEVNPTFEEDRTMATAAYDVLLTALTNHEH